MLPVMAALSLAGSAVAGSEELNLITLADLYSEVDVRDVAISPSGRYLAVVVKRGDRDVVLVHDLQNGTSTSPSSVNHEGAGEQMQMRLSNVYWKSDDRVLFRVEVFPKPGAKTRRLKPGDLAILGDRLFAINRDGSRPVRLLNDSASPFNWGALNLGAMSSVLPKDPDHILMVVYGLLGPSIMRVDVNTGTSEIVESPTPYLVGWWMDVEGRPVVREERSAGTVRFYRKQDDGAWKEFYHARLKDARERAEYAAIGASDQPGKYYVIARPPGREHSAVYLYDLAREEFGDPVVENDRYDIDSAHVSRDGTRLLYHCYVIDVRYCEFTDPKTNAHMQGVRRYFSESANVSVAEASEDGNTILLYVEGPSVAPSYYYYRVDQKKIELVGTVRSRLAGKATASATAVRWKARDGRELTGYLTRPPGALKATGLPAIVMPHGGPEMRDRLKFDPWVQFLAAQGFAVFQPNFRGSDGFGRAFAESGYRQWGRAMQDDITDGLLSLTAQSIVDPARVCIVGGSYGGYAALVGAALTPDLYKCAVSISGVTDLPAYVKWYKSEYGARSAGAAYWVRAIGDPVQNRAQLHEVSPVKLANAIKADVLLIHGTRDNVVPISQSQAMKRALDNSRRKIALIKLEDEGHSYWTDEDEMSTLATIDAFLEKNLGAGFSVVNASKADTTIQ